MHILGWNERLPWEPPGAAAVHLVGLYGKFRLRMRGGEWLLCEAAIVPPGEWHELDFGGEPFAALYIEPNLGAFGALSPLLQNQRAAGRALIGTAPEAALLRCLYEDRLGEVWAGAALDDVLDYSRRRSGAASLDPRLSRSCRLPPRALRRTDAGRRTRPRHRPLLVKVTASFHPGDRGSISPLSRLEPLARGLAGDRQGKQLHHGRTSVRLFRIQRISRANFAGHSVRSRQTDSDRTCDFSSRIRRWGAAQSSCAIRLWTRSDLRARRGRDWTRERATMRGPPALFIPHSASQRQTSVMILLVFVFALASCGAFCADALAQPAQQNQCFSTAETRDKIAAHGLTEPLRSIEKAAAHFQAEALAAKLCRRDDGFVYEISLLRRDGKIVRSLYDAKTGQIIETKAAK